MDSARLSNDVQNLLLTLDLTVQVLTDRHRAGTEPLASTAATFAGKYRDNTAQCTSLNPPSRNSSSQHEKCPPSLTLFFFFACF